jgi:hypothetical protein
VKEDEMGRVCSMKGGKRGKYNVTGGKVGKERDY